MTTERAFLDDVIEHPDDDGPRLVCADWLEDNGQPDRAELIRTQIALARSAVDDPRRPSLRQREAELLAEHGPSWAEPLRGLVHSFEFVRGFVERVSMTHGCAGDPPLDEHLHETFRRAPVRSLDIDFYTGDEGFLAAFPDVLARLTELRLGAPVNELDERDLRRLVASPELRNLTALLVQADYPEWAPMSAFRRLGDYPHLAGLTVLGFATDEVEPRVLRGVLRSPHLTRLRRLYLNGLDLSRPLAKEMADSVNLAGLTHLSLESCQMRPGALPALLTAPFLGRLEWLNLYEADVPADGWQELVRGRARPGVLRTEEPEEHFPHWSGPRTTEPQRFRSDGSPAPE